jgi:arylsulfatase A-like enzyme
LASAGLDSKQHIDGLSLVPVLKNPKAILQRDTLYWHYPLAKPHFLGGHSSGAVRKGDWKLVEYFDADRKELYNLADDISEKNNLASKNPEKVAELQGLLKAWRKDVGAKIPSGQSG